MNSDPSPSAPMAGSTRVQRWSAPPCPFAIDYSVDVMNRIRQRAVEGFRAVPHGGLEVGGVLFGRVYPNARTPLRVEIAAERPIECGHSSGPSFILSEEEIAEIGSALERSRLDSELAPLSVMGFWVSHGRSTLSLTPEDRELFTKLFPNPWQIVLVLKPESGGPTRASFSFRNGGQVSVYQPAFDFYADTHLVAVKPPPPDASAPQNPENGGSVASGHYDRYQPIARDRRGHLMAPQESTQAEEEPTPPSEVGRRLAWPVVAGLMALSATLGAGLLYSFKGFPRPVTSEKGHAPDINLEMFNAGPSVLIHWNAKSVEVQEAVRGELVVHDGTKEQLYPLDLGLLRLGYLRYQPGNTAVSATLRVFGLNGSVEQTSTRFAPQ